MNAAWAAVAAKGNEAVRQTAETAAARRRRRRRRRKSTAGKTMKIALKKMNCMQMSKWWPWQQQLWHAVCGGTWAEAMQNKTTSQPENKQLSSSNGSAVASCKVAR